MSVLKITFKSIRRRFPQIWKAALTTLVAVFFVTAVLIFQENMYQWQMSSNKSRFGDWYICEKTTKEPNKVLDENDFLEKPLKAESTVRIFDSDWNNTKLYVGSMTDDFMKQGRIRLAEGRMPEASDEITMDWNTLLKLGYEGELGQKVTINYYENDNINSDKGRLSATFTLVGILNNYTNIWQDGKNIPGAIVTEERLKEFKTSVYKGYKQDKIEMRGDRAEMSDFPLYLNTVAGGLDRRDQTIGGFSFVVKIYAVPVVEIIG